MNSIRHRDEDLKLKDGTILKSRIWVPHGEGPWPALLMRQPYSREIASLKRRIKRDPFEEQFFLSSKH